MCVCMWVWVCEHGCVSAHQPIYVVHNISLWCYWYVVFVIILFCTNMACLQRRFYCEIFWFCIWFVTNEISCLRVCCSWPVPLSDPAWIIQINAGCHDGFNPAQRPCIHAHQHQQLLRHDGVICALRIPGRLSNPWCT